MFQSAYQDGDCVEVLSPAGKNPAADWKLSGKVVRMYEKGVKGYVLAVSGGATSKMQLPKAPKSQLGLRQRHLVLQVLTSTSQDKPFSLELGLTDTGGTRRRLVLSSSFRALHCTPLHAQIPLVGLERHRGSWANLTIDLVGLTAVCFKAGDFRTLDLLAIGPTCRLRKVFTMKEALDDSSGAGGDDDHSELISAGASGQNNGVGCKSAPVAPMPLRMAFPAGVVPAPQNWVISVSTLRRLASRDVPPPSLSKRNSLVTTSSAKGRKNRLTFSLQEPSLKGGPLSVSPAMASLCIPEEARSFRSSRGGAAERGTPSPRLLKIRTGNPSSSSSIRASPTGTLQQQRSISSNGSRNSSPRPIATSSPLATPARRRSTGTIVTCSNSRTPSSTSSTPRLPTAHTVSVRDGSSARSVGRRDGVMLTKAIGGSSTPVGKPSTGDVTSVCRTPSRAATAEATTPSCTPRRTPSSMAGGGLAADAHEITRNEPKGTGTKRGGLLPARLRASKVSSSSGRTREVGYTEAAEDGGDSGTDGEGDGQIAREPPAEWRVAGDWNGRQEKPAPAWSMLDDSSPDDGFRAVTPQAKHAYSIQAEDILQVPTTTRCGTSGSHATASIAHHENSGAASELAYQGLGGGVRVIAGTPSSSPQPSPEVPANIDVSWLERHKREDGEAVAATSPEARDSRSASSRFRPWSSAAINVSAAIAENSGAFDLPNTYFAADAVVKHIEDGDKKMRSATRASLFASPFSPREETSAIARRSPLSAGDASRGGKMQRSPMSARVDVLQNLLAPGAMGGEDLRPDSGKKCEKAQVSRTETQALPNGKDGGGDNGSGIAGDADALEHLLVHSTIKVDTGSSVRGDNGSPGTTCASSSFDTIARPANCGPDACVVSSSRDDHRDEDGTDRHRTIATKEVIAVPTQVAHAYTDVPTGLSALDGGHLPGGQATSLSLAEESGATAATSRKSTRSGNIGENDDREEIDGFSSTCGEGARGVLESSFCRATNRERGHGENAEPPMAVDRSDLEELKRKESALLDLEESYHTEFGSVDLSQSPKKHDFFAGDCSPDRTSAPAENIEAEVHSSMKTNILRRRMDHGGPDESVAFSIARSIETSSRQRASECNGGHDDDDDDDDDDVDSVVLGSRGSTSSPAPREEEGREKTRSQQGGGRGKDNELYFDPVLNCYYDRTADKYYELH